MKDLYQLDRLVSMYHRGQLFLDIEENHNGSPRRKAGAVRVAWPDSAPYVSCHDPQHYFDMFGFIKRHVERPTPIAEPGGAIILDPEFVEYPSELRAAFAFNLSPQLVRQHVIAKIRHALVRGRANHKVSILEVHAGLNECGVPHALNWSLEELIASQLRAANNVRSLVPEHSGLILPFHYYWKNGRRTTYLVNERLWRRELGL